MFAQVIAGARQAVSGGTVKPATAVTDTETWADGLPGGSAVRS
jgi:hypothetical protein